MRKGSGRGMDRLRELVPRAPASQLGAVSLAIAGVFTAVLAAANDQLSGATLVFLVLGGTLGGLLIVEAGHRTGPTRFVLGCAGLGFGAVVVSLAVVDAPSGETTTASATTRSPEQQSFNANGLNRAVPPLRVTITQVPPDVYYVAFAGDPGIPAENEGWKDLIDLGGVDVRLSVFEVTLANRSPRPITVSDVHLEVVGVDDPPTGALAYQFTQGDSGLGEFSAHIEVAVPGSEVPLYDVTSGVPGWRAEPPSEPFFDRRFISLEPGEIYEAKLAVETEIPARITYRVVAEGSTPDREFELRDPQQRQISGISDPDSDQYGNYYVEGFLQYMRHVQCPSLEVRRWFEKLSGVGLGECPSDL